MCQIPITKSKHVLITGASGSIGSMLATAFDSGGWIVHHWDIRNPLLPNGEVDAVIIAHGGTGTDQHDTYEKNAISVGRAIADAQIMLRDGGALIVFTSRRAVIPTVAEWDYAAAKAAAHAYTRAMYRAAPTLRITAIACGWVESIMATKANAASCIPITQLAEIILTIAESTGMRIPELIIEPIGDAEY